MHIHKIIREVALVKSTPKSSHPAFRHTSTTAPKPKPTKQNPQPQIDKFCTFVVAPYAGVVISK